MPTCTTCSQEIAPTSAFCSHCGSPNPETGATPPESDAVLLQRRLQAALGNGFAVEAPLGEGGFAVVFGVFDRKLSRRIAVKVLRPELTASRASKQRFIREAETVARLNHPHILPIFFVGEAQGLVWFGMPLVEGETLEARLRRDGRLSEEETARIGGDIADALGEAHAAGLVHRDVKPLNVMLQGAKGRVLVADFGIAKAAAGSGEDQLTGTGIAIGSPHYMSPEQASGDTQVDHRSDIYSLGILLWQMLVGELPFASGGSQAVIMQQVSRDVPPLKSRRPEVGAALASIVERCVQKRRDDRFQSADEVAQALRAVAHGGRGSSAATRPAPAWAGRAVRWGAILAVLLIGVVLVRQVRTRAPAAAARPGGAADSDAVAPASAAPAIAVLPFSAVGASDTAQFGRSGALMLSEALNLRNGVGTVDGNALLSRWIAERRSVTAPLDSNARFAWTLGANQMIVGSYVESGRSFRLSLALYDTHDIARLWAGEITGNTDSLFALLDRLASQVAAALCAQPSYNPANICFDTPARPRVPLAVDAAGADTAASLAFHAHVNGRGEVDDVRLTRTSGDGDASSQALGLLRDARFEPARRGGRPVEAWTTVQVALRSGAAAGASAPASAAASATCADPAVAVKNPDHACFDTRPVPRVVPVAALPAECRGAVEPVNVQIQVGASGDVAGAARVTRSSGCPAFDAAALAAAPGIRFVPASKGGRAVAAWVVLQIRPAAGDR